MDMVSSFFTGSFTLLGALWLLMMIWMACYFIKDHGVMILIGTTGTTATLVAALYVLDTYMTTPTMVFKIFLIFLGLGASLLGNHMWEEAHAQKSQAHST